MEHDPKVISGDAGCGLLKFLNTNIYIYLREQYVHCICAILLQTYISAHTRSFNFVIFKRYLYRYNVLTSKRNVGFTRTL